MLLHSLILAGTAAALALASPSPIPRRQAAPLAPRQQPPYAYRECIYDPDGYATPHGEETYVRLVLHAYIPNGADDIPWLCESLSSMCGGDDKIENYGSRAYGNVNETRQFEIGFDMPAGVDVACVPPAIERTLPGEHGVQCDKVNLHGGPGGP